MTTGRDVLRAVEGIEDVNERVYVAFTLAMTGTINEDIVRLVRGAWASMDDGDAAPWLLAVIAARRAERSQFVEWLRKEAERGGWVGLARRDLGKEFREIAAAVDAGAHLPEWPQRG